MIFFNLLLITLLINQNVSDIDFGDNKQSQEWYSVNDNVMGGVSTGKLTLSDSSIVFKGKISFENNGGFASFRAPWGEYDFSKIETIEIRYRSYNLDFAFTLATDRRFYKPYYKGLLKKTNGKWIIKKLKVNALQEYILNDKTGNLLSSEKQSKVIRMGFISSEKKDEEFEIEIDYIKFR